MPANDALFELIPDAVVTVDHEGVIRQVNSRLTTMFAYDESDLLGQPMEVLLPDRIRRRHVGHRKAFQLMPTVRSMGAGIELHGRRKDGSEFPVDIMLSHLTSPEQLTLAVIRDISTSKKLSDDLKKLAYNDPLTDLPNRASLYLELEKLLKCGAAPSLQPTSIVLFDLDGFKEVNDTLGHSTGDQLLNIVGKRWAAVVGDGASIYRLGGDEFVAVFPNCGDPCRVAGEVDRMLVEIQQSFEIGGKVVHVSASAGIAIAPADGANVEELMANVDLALYRAKATSSGSYIFFHHLLRAEAEARRDLDLKLRRAHTNGEFQLYYQPQIRLADSVVVGAEALLRWRRDDGIVVAPGAFIDALAGSAIAIDVGTWILRTACEAAAAWRKQGLLPIRIAVNLFPSQFHDPAFLDTVKQILADTELPPTALELEITENIALTSDDATLELLHKLRQLGVQLAFDDFGTGYGSLRLLTQMALTHIKIDQSFIRDLSRDAKVAAITRSLIVMAHNIGLGVIAEGVETAPQLNFLKAEGCDEAQGFIFAKPLPAPEFEALLRVATPIRRIA
uniref:putative bifunctional diguanylate cyclase/phosphodiesterase n=1 Tax=Pararhizobium sp. IMCC3301 TaxID=3067904 RepID=UPI002740F790|nr:EAL domain-containing protein [Pararhizobium sp. IMCC3301]